MKQKPLFSIGIRDVAKGFLMAFLGMFVTMLMSVINNNAFPTNWAEWKVILVASLGSGLAYLVKNFFTSSDDKFLKKEEPKQ